MVSLLLVFGWLLPVLALALTADAAKVESSEEEEEEEEEEEGQEEMGVAKENRSIKASTLRSFERR